MNSLLDYLPMLLLTIFLEGLIATLLAGPDRRRVVLDLTLLNLVTHPLGTLFMSRVDGFEEWFLLELAILLSETLGLRIVTQLGWARACTVAASCNLVTATLGCVLAS